MQIIILVIANAWLCMLNKGIVIHCRSLILWARFIQFDQLGSGITSNVSFVCWIGATGIMQLTLRCQVRHCSMAHGSAAAKLGQLQPMGNNYIRIQIYRVKWCFPRHTWGTRLDLSWLAGISPLSTMFCLRASTSSMCKPSFRWLRVPVDIVCKHCSS